MCVQYHKELAKQPQDEPSSPSPETDNSSNSTLRDSSEPGYPSTAQDADEDGIIMLEDLKEHELSVLIESITLLGESPLHVRKLTQINTQRKRKLDKVWQRN